MKKILSWLLAITMLVGMCPAWAVDFDVPENDLSIENGGTADLHYEPITPPEIDLIEEVTGTCGENLTWTLTMDGTLAISGAGAMTDFEAVDDQPWLSYAPYIKKIDILGGVTTIGDRAFTYFSSLTDVTIPDGITRIGRSAFWDCISLKSVQIPDGVTFLGRTVFYGCTSLKSIDIPDSVTSIGDYAFETCNNLASVTLPNGITSLGTGTFYGCIRLGSITIPNSVTHIGDYAFANCNNLANVTLPSGITSIGVEVFFDCSNLTSIEIPDSVTSIGDGAFGECRSLRSIEIPDSVTSIGDKAFMNCNSLRSVVISDRVTSIGDNAFIHCDNLTEITVAAGNVKYCSEDGVLFDKNKTTLMCYPGNKSGSSYTIPGSVTNIVEGTFAGCTRLSKILVSEDNTHYCSEDGVLFNKDKTTLICYPAKKSGKDYTIQTGVTSVGIYAFANNNKLTEIWISDSLTDLGHHAFMDCTSLESIRIHPNDMTSIEFGVFLRCESLEKIHLPYNVNRIDGWAFRDCSSLTDICFTRVLTSVGDHAFWGCSSFADVLYMGTQEEWKNISIGIGNKYLTSAVVRYNEPTYPAGYFFLTDSYSFRNYSCNEIAKDYFTTMYESAPGAALHELMKYSGQAGLCFGISYTAAAIYNGLPSCSEMNTIDDHTLEFTMCTHILDIVNYNIPSFPSFSSYLKIADQTITIDDYIKYAFIYQWSEGAQKACYDTLKNQDIQGLYDTVKTMTDNGLIGVMIGLSHGTKNLFGNLEIDSGHYVLAIGYHGRDIVIYDSNTPRVFQLLRINKDGSWSYSNPWSSDNKLDSENGRIAYTTDFDKPYQILLTGQGTTVGSGLIDETVIQETYIENMERLDADNTLLYIEVPGSAVLPADTVEITYDASTTNDGNNDDTGYSGALYWVKNTDSVSISGLSGEQNSVMIANDDTIISVESGALTAFNGTINESSKTVEVITSAETECSVSYVTVTEEKDVEVRISGTASEDGVSIQNSEDGLVVEGFSSGTIELLYDDQVQESIEFSDEDQSFTVSYDETGEDPTVDVTADETDEKTEDILLGDVNSDGKVNGTDTNLIFRYVSGTTDFSDEQLKAADVNGDGKVNGTDTNLVFRFVSGTIESLG